MIPSLIQLIYEYKVYKKTCIPLLLVVRELEHLHTILKIMDPVSVVC